MNSLNRYLTHNLRNIPRIVLVLLIIAAFGMAIAKVPSQPKVQESKNSVKGARSFNEQILNDEIEKTLKVVQERPDYAGAWVRLSVLYDQVGEVDKSKSALETALRLNPKVN